jgi:hypothetical protein
MPIVLNGTDGITQADQFNSDSTFGFKNRIINGAMMIDQRNAGASITNDTTNTQFPVDRFGIWGQVASKYTAQQNAGSVTPPAGFTNYLGITSSSAYTPLGANDLYMVAQQIEGFNTADLNWGTANAKTVTLSFWVRSSGLTYPATFGGSLQNSAVNRSYPFAYTISAANTWEQKSITIPGDISGTWVGATNGIGIRVWFALGVGTNYSGTAGAVAGWAGADYRSVTSATNVLATNGATLYITGVQLEVGSTATSFDYRPYTTELQLCQRYFQTYGYGIGSPNEVPLGTGYYFTSVEAIVLAYFSVTMRTKPTYSSATVTNGYRYSRPGASTTINSLPYYGTSSQSIAFFGDINVPVAGSAGNAVVIIAEQPGARVNFSAEL